MRTMQLVHEEMAILMEAVTTMPALMEIPLKMAYLVINKQDNLISQIAIPPLHAEIDTVEVKFIKIK